MLNLAASYVQQFLPHILAKINRVTYGLLKEHDPMPPNAPLVRKYMAVPFIAKDVPSYAAEFAHPDVLIGLTILAYRYEGMREKDVKRVIKQIKFDYSQETGPRELRIANIAYMKYVKLGKIQAVQRGTETLLEKLRSQEVALVLLEEVCAHDCSRFFVTSCLPSFLFSPFPIFHRLLAPLAIVSWPATPKQS